MSRMRWGENQTYQFTKLYLKREFLYNPELSDYRLKVKRSMAYKEIAAEFHELSGILLHETEVRLKIKNLRSTYVQEVAKIKLRSTSDWTYKPHMKWFHDWHKCMIAVKRGEELSYDDNQDIEESTDEACPKIWLSPNDDQMEEVETLDPFPDDEYTILLKTEPRDHLQTNEGSKRRFSTKKSKIKRRSPSTDCSDPIFRGSIDSSASTSTKEDEFDIYGKYIASQLRNLAIQKALRVQLEIQSLVSEARLSELNSKD